MEVVENGYERPVVCGGLTHETVDRIMDLCPGTRVEGLPVALVDETTKQDLVWGAYQSMVLGHASDPKVRHQGSTGGVLTALGQFLVATGEVEFILHAKASERDPTFGDRALSRTGRGVGGRRVALRPHRAADRCSKATRYGKRFAFIGKFCDTAALRNLALYDQRVDAQVDTMLAMVCGGFMPPRA